MLPCPEIHQRMVAEDAKVGAEPCGDSTRSKFRAAQSRRL
jgi:hypothetical protein